MSRERKLKDSDINRQLLASSRRVRKFYQLFAVVVVTAFISSAVTLTVYADGPSGFGTVIEPGSMVSDPDYSIFMDSGAVFVKNGKSGEVTEETDSLDVLMTSLQAELPNGGTIQLRDGAYTIDTTIVISTANISFHHYNAQIIASGALTVGVLDVEADNVTIQGARIEAGAGFGIKVGESNFVQLIDCRASNATSYPFYLRGMSNGVIDRCMGNGAGDDGFTWTYGQPGNVTVSNCIAYGNSDAGFEVGDGGGRISFTNCISRENGYAGFTLNNHVDSEWGFDVSISNCQVYDCPRGVYVGNQNATSQCHGLVVTGCVFNSCLGGALVCSGGIGVIFDSNYAYYGTGADVLNSTGVHVTNNYFDVQNYSGPGINVDEKSHDILISNNDVRNIPAGRRGIMCEANHTILTGNRVQNGLSYGIWLNVVHGCIVSDNYVRNVTTYGIRLDSAYNNSIISNILESGYITMSGGIGEVSGDYNIIANNIFISVTTGVGVVGTHTIVMDNLGYRTSNWGTATISAGVACNFPHGLVKTPDIVICAFNNTGYGSYSWSASSTTVWIGVNNTGYYTVSWYAFAW